MQERVYWTDAEVEELRQFYLAHRGGLIPLSAWAREHGRAAPNVARKARQLGLTEPMRPKKPPPKPVVNKWPTIEEARAAIGRSVRDRLRRDGHPRGALGLKHTEETKRKLSAALSARWQAMTPEKQEVMRLKRNATNIAKYGTAAPAFGRADQPYSNCRGGKRADLGDRYFRSAWEANYARYLNFLLAQGQIRGWEYEADTFVFEGVTRGAVTYTPDFKVTDNDGTVVYHEVKGWLTSRAKMALKRMAKLYPTVKIRLVDEPVYRALSRQCSHLIPHWEGRK